MATAVTPDNGQQRVDWALVWPIVIGFLLLVAVVGTLSWLSSISGWSTVYGPTGTFVADERCEATELRLTSRVTCRGRFVPGGGEMPSPATLTGPSAAFGERAPVPGEEVGVYHRVADTSSVYPSEGRTTEFVRLAVGGLDSLFALVGTAMWMVGWWLTHRISGEEAELRRYRYRFHQRFDLQGRAIRWMAVAAVLWLVDRFVLDGLLGTSGLG
ncbi:MAG: hypothetical protein AAGD35_08785 [Actinomycetota bacterium]